MKISQHHLKWKNSIAYPKDKVRVYTATLRAEQCELILLTYCCFQNALALKTSKYGSDLLMLHQYINDLSLWFSVRPYTPGLSLLGERTHGSLHQ